MERKRVALIGAGRIGAEAHLPAYLGMKGQAEVVGICDACASRAEKLARDFRVPRSFTSPEQMLETMRPEIVSVCTPNQTHGNLIRCALEHDAHVLCEKPLCLDAEEAKALFALAKTKGKLLMACQTHRFSPAVQAARAYMQSEGLGTLYHLEMDRVRRRGVPGWGGFTSRAVNGGGALCDIGIHMLDSLLWLAGEPRPLKALCVARSPLYGRAGFDVEEFAAGTLLLEGNVTLNLKVAWAANLPDRAELTMLGDRAGLAVPSLQVWGDEWQRTLPILPDVYADRAFAGHWHVIEHFLAAVREEEEPVVTAPETINAIAALQALYRSAFENGFFEADDSASKK